MCNPKKSVTNVTLPLQEKEVLMNQMGKKRLTSPHGFTHGTPTLASRLSCFVGGCHSCTSLRELVLHRLHRHGLSASPAVVPRISRFIVKHGSRFTAKEKSGVLVKHASAFTQANDLAWNPQTLFRCQGTTDLFFLKSAKAEVSSEHVWGSDCSACGQPFFIPIAPSKRSSKWRV